MKKIIIAIDGPAGSGKSTTARLVAERLGYIYIDTGAMYRAVTLACIENKIDLSEGNVCSLLEKVRIRLESTLSGQKTYLNGVDVSNEIRSAEVTKMVSPVSAMACVRENLVRQQRSMGVGGGVVMDGRDIGTVVFPNADLKIYLVASIEDRAKRRTLELEEKGIQTQVEEIKQQIISRDKYDSTREISPLRKASDSIEIDTSGLTIEEQTDKVVALALGIINGN